MTGYQEPGGAEPGGAEPVGAESGDEGDAESLNTCSFCRKVTSDDLDEDVGIQSSHGATICLSCASKAILVAYKGGFRSETLEKGISALFEISAQAEAEIIAMKSDEIAARYQRRLLEAREPAPTFDESDRVTITLSVTKYTKRKIDALAREASMGASEWIRSAIFLAFQETKAEED